MLQKFHAGCGSANILWNSKAVTCNLSLTATQFDIHTGRPVRFVTRVETQLLMQLATRMQPGMHQDKA